MKVFKEYAGLIDEAMKFHSHDPVGGLLERPGDMPLGTRCTEVPVVFISSMFLRHAWSLVDSVANQVVLVCTHLLLKD